MVESKPKLTAAQRRILTRASANGGSFQCDRGGAPGIPPRVLSHSRRSGLISWGPGPEPETAIWTITPAGSAALKAEGRDHG